MRGAVVGGIIYYRADDLVQTLETTAMQLDLENRFREAQVVRNVAAALTDGTIEAIEKLGAGAALAPPPAQHGHQPEGNSNA